MAALGACDSSEQAGPPPDASASAPGVFLNVLPPGSDGNSGDGTGSASPPHAADQLALYGDLSYAQAGLSSTTCSPPASASDHQPSSQLACNYFKGAGLVPETVVSTEMLTSHSGGNVTIQRDTWGVPFVSGATRVDAMYGSATPRQRIASGSSISCAASDAGGSPNFSDRRTVSTRTTRTSPSSPATTTTS